MKVNPDITKVTDEEIAEGVRDEVGGIYSQDGKRFLKWDGDRNVESYTLKEGTEVVCDHAFDIFCACGTIYTSLPYFSNIVFPTSLKHIGAEAFIGMGKLEHVTFPEGLLTIGEKAFAQCMIKEVTVPENTTLGYGAFYYNPMAWDKVSRFDLNRFIYAQDEHPIPGGPTMYEIALAEVKNGRKDTHWIWYIFPQMVGLGHSEMSRRYGINGREEAEAYIQNPILRDRLVEITQAVYDNKDHNAYEILGNDAIKFRSCMQLFASVSDIPLFKKVLSYYNWR